MSIKVKTGSSIWKLATYWGSDNLPNNLCDLVRNTVWCFCVSFFVVGLLSAWVAFILASIAASFNVGYVIWSAEFSVFVGVICLILAAFCSELLSSHLRRNPSERLNNAKTVYTSWKDKFCPLVKEIK
jgi:hypothetical protein